MNIQETKQSTQDLLPELGKTVKFTPLELDGGFFKGLMELALFLDSPKQMKESLENQVSFYQYRTSFLNRFIQANIANLIKTEVIKQETVSPVETIPQGVSEVVDPA
jgi:hypothetical protein